METSWHWSAPANLLVAGEYAITHPGGQGLAMAVAPRAHCRVHPASGDLEVVAVTAAGAERFSPGDGHPIVDSVFAECSPVAPPAARIEIDTATFFDAATGQKLGLGSSAVATLLLTAALFRLSGRDPLADLDEVVSVAIRAHRRAHNGRGSGYDVATSALGGVVHFRGGPDPVWRPSAFAACWRSENLSLYGWHGRAAVASSGAVARFDRYLPTHSDDRRRFVARNNACVSALEEADSWNGVFGAVSAARDLSEEIGAAIGVPARLDLCVPHADDGWVAKTSGAGNERALILAVPTPRRPVPRQAAALPFSTDGLRQESSR